MPSPRTALVALVAVALAACSAGPATQPTATAHVTEAPVTATPAANPPTEPPTEPPTPRPTASATPKPTATPRPVPPKPRGLLIESPCLLDCRPSDLAGYRLSWKAPRTKGVEIRVYGVTTCFRTDDPEGGCLREHTALPDDIRVLLAKGPASKGVLDLDIAWMGDGDQAEDGCTYFGGTKAGTRFYSIVVAAYNANGHSIFAIADDGYYMPGECVFDVI